MDSNLDADALWTAFYADEVADSELVTLLSHHFQAGRMDPGSDVVELARGQDGEPVLMLHYVNGSLARIEPGPGLAADDVEQIRARIEDTALPSGNLQVGRQVFFSRPEVTGWWRYRDMFQLVPAPADAPRPGFVMAMHPFVVEIAYPATDDHLIRLVRERQRFWELGLLLELLLHGSTHVLGDRKPHHWVLDGSDEGIVTKYLNEGYGLDGFTFITDSFSDMSEIHSMQEIPDDEYYAARGISVDQKMAVPELMEAALDRYFDLAEPERERFLRACYWLQHASQVWDISHTSHYVALINAVEALLPSTESDPCPVCGKDQSKGPTAKFADFLDAYAPAKEFDPPRRELYRVRSKITHGHALLLSDTPRHWGVLEPAEFAEYERSGNTKKVVQVALLNWLLQPETSAA
jgi:hypothetical protein